MKWLDGNYIDIKKFSGEELCEKISLELWDYERSEWFEFDDFIQTALFLIDFDTELCMEGIFTCLENSICNYLPYIIKAFRTIGDNEDAEILSEIYRLACHAHELSEEISGEIERLESKLYLNTGFDMWKLLYDYLDRRISEL